MTVEILLLIAFSLAILTFFLFRVRVLDHDDYIAEMVDLLEDARNRGDYRKALKISRVIEKAREA